MGESTTRFVHRIGIELEGFWRVASLMKGITWDPIGNIYKFPLVEDQSLVASEFPPEKNGVRHVGEWTSPPLPVEEGINWMRGHYPDATNARCGLHVHTSFRRTEHYRALVDKEFFSYFRGRMLLWGKAREEEVGPDFFVRLAGNNKYCPAKFTPERQVHLKHKRPLTGEDGETIYPRRSMLNYCWEMHRTIECRLFPMWTNPETSEAAIRELISCYEDWLRDNYKGDQARSVVLKRVGRTQTIERHGEGEEQRR